MHLEFLLEEPSAEAVLRTILPKILSEDVSSDFLVFKGKEDLLKKLPERLKTYHQWIPDDWRIIVLVDEDRTDCHDENRSFQIFKCPSFALLRILTIED